MTRAEWAAMVGLVGIAAVVVLVHPFPPCNDGSSHLATAWIFRELLRGNEVVAGWYAFDAVPLPYWSATLLLQPLLALVEPLLAWRMLMVLYAVALPLSYLYLLRVAVPENQHLAPIAALCVFNWSFWFGEAPFLIGLPLAILGFALWLRAERLGWHFAAFAGVAVLVYLSHVFALCALCGAVGLRVLQLRFRMPTAQWAGLGLLGVLFLGAVWLVFGAHGTGANNGEVVFDWSLWRLRAIWSFPIGGDTAGTLWPSTAFVGLVGLAWLGPAGVQEPGGGYENIGQRFTLWALLLGVGGLSFPEGRPRQALLAAVVALGAVTSYEAWRQHEAYQGPAERVVAMLPVGAKLLALQDLDQDHFGVAEHLHRIANHVVTLRGGYSGLVFAKAGQQPLRHLRAPDYRAVNDLKVTEAEWAFFDHVLLQSDADPPRISGLVERAERISATDGFSLWRIRR